MVIQSQKNSLDLEIKTINNGKLRVKLRGLDVRDKNGERFPVFIDYSSFCINGIEQLSHNILTHHDDYFLFEKEVEDSEAIKIYLEWLPFNSSSYYSNDVKRVSKEYRKLNKKYDSLKEENSKLKLRVSAKIEFWLAC